MIFEFYAFWLKILGGLFGSILAGILAVYVWEYWKEQAEVKKFNSIFKKVLTLPAGYVFVSRYRDHLDAIAFEIKLMLFPSERKIQFDGERKNEEGVTEKYNGHFIIDLKTKTGEGIYTYQQSSHTVQREGVHSGEPDYAILQRKPFGFSRMIYDENHNLFYVMDHYAQHVPEIYNLKPLKWEKTESYIWSQKDYLIPISNVTSVPTANTETITQKESTVNRDSNPNLDFSSLKRLVFWRK